MDYYKLLSVNKNASEQEIKKAYRKLAIKCHPDRGGNEEEFKNISKAYQTLSNKNKRKIYDLTGSTDEEVDNNFDAFNIFNKFFQKMTSDIPTNFTSNFGDIKVDIYKVSDDFDVQNDIHDEKKTEDIYYNLNINLEDIYNKKVKKIKLEHRRLVDEQYIDLPIEYKIPVYIRESIFHEEAHDKRGFTKRGNVIFNIYDKDHEKFKRVNDFDLMMMHYINLYDIYKGFSFKFTHLDGKEITVQSRPESLVEQGHFYQKLQGYGLPNQLNFSRGDLFIRYIVNFPHIDKVEKISDGHDLDNKDYDFKYGNDKVEIKNTPYENVYKDVE